MWLENFWIVRNPSPASTVPDICEYWTNGLDEFIRQTNAVDGVDTQKKGCQDFAIHTTEASATLDARKRIENLRGFREAQNRSRAILRDIQD